MSMLGFILKNWKYILFSIVFFSTGVYLSWHIQAIKIDKLNAEKMKLKNELKQCISTNESNQKTISMLQTEIKKANKLCALRLNIKKKQ